MDASALAEFLLDTPVGRDVGQRMTVADTVHVPHLAIVETASVIRRWSLNGHIRPARARQALRDLADLPVQRHPHDPYLSRIWAWRENVSAYDAVYVALAEALGVALLTCDRPLGRAPVGEVAIHVVG